MERKLFFNFNLNMPFFKRKTKYLEPLLVEKNEQIFYIQNVNPGDVIFDIGANLGELTLLFSRFADTNGQVHSFEPTPSTFEKLSTVLTSFNKKNVLINNLAVSDKSGFVTFNIYDEAYGSWNTMAKRPLQNYGVFIQPPKTIQVAAVSVDDYCAERAINHIDILKIDVEGAELNVLKGSQKMFREKKIKLCVFEFGQTIHDMGNTSIDLLNFFEEHNYSVRNIAKNQVVFPVNNKTNLAYFSIHYAKSK